MIKPRPKSTDTAENITNYPQQIQHTLSSMRVRSLKKNALGTTMQNSHIVA